MNRTTAFLICIACGVGNSHADQARQLIDLLSTNNLDTFTAIVEAHRIPAPVIHSQWFADHAETDVERAGISRARELGSNLLEWLDKYAEHVLAVSNLVQSPRQADVLLRAAAWIGRAEGYGNAILAARAHDVATVPASRLVVATNYPTDQVISLLSRFTGAWYAPEVRARILDAEVEGNVFTGSGTRPLTQRALEEVWTAGLWRRASKRGEIAPDFMLTGVDQGWVTVSVLDQHLDFFETVEFSGDRTTRERWTSKDHESLVLGIESANVRMLRSLARFRELVGEFPTAVPYTNHPFSSQQEAAFEHAWRPHRAKEGAIYGDASYVYQTITHGHFIDRDTAILLIRKGKSSGNTVN